MSCTIARPRCPLPRARRRIGRQSHAGPRQAPSRRRPERCAPPPHLRSTARACRRSLRLGVRKRAPRRWRYQNSRTAKVGRRCRMRRACAAYVRPQHAPTSGRRRCRCRCHSRRLAMRWRSEHSLLRLRSHSPSYFQPVPIRAKREAVVLALCVDASAQDIADTGAPALCPAIAWPRLAVEDHPRSTGRRHWAQSRLVPDAERTDRLGFGWLCCVHEIDGTQQPIGEQPAKDCLQGTAAIHRYLVEFRSWRKDEAPASRLGRAICGERRIAPQAMDMNNAGVDRICLLANNTCKSNE